MVEQALPKQKLQIHLQGDIDSFSEQQRASTLEALARTMDILPDEIEVYDIYRESIVFDLRVPPNAIQQIRSKLVANSSQLRLLGVEKVFFERSSGQVEMWRVQSGSFSLEVSTHKESLQDKFVPVPDIWRFHVIYLVVTLMMGLAIFPYSQYASLFLISGVCAFGIFLSLSKKSLAAHILAVAIGLGAPVVVFAWLLPVQTVIFFLVLITILIMARRFLF